MKRLLAACLGLAALIQPLNAQGPGQVERALGPWELSNPAGDRKCAVTFRADRAGAGLALDFAPSCADLFPAISSVSGWRALDNGNIAWLDSTGQVNFDYGETEVGIFEAIRPGDPSIYFLTNLGLAGAQLPQPADLVGAWALAQPRARPLCTLTFRDDLVVTANALEQRFALDVASGCERSIAAQNFSAWRLERELLMVFGSGGAVFTFKRDPDGRWMRAPPENRPLILSRP